MAEDKEKRCPQCGGELPANAPSGVCPKCLMKVGLPTGADVEKAPDADSQKEIPTIATPPGGFVPPEPKELGKKFPQLEILELLGQGGMGAVYKARQKQLDRLVALKILPPEVGQAEAFAERFTREAQSLAKLNHPQIVTVHEFGHTEDGLYYFLMEFVDGTDLRHVIQAGELKADQALAIVPQLCDALQYAHKKGIVHRDIKPENILLDKEGNIKIADFGLAMLLDRPTTDFTLTQAGQRMGTPHYMAPEQIEGAHEVDHRADIYSLGVVFYEMLTGELPLGRFAPPSKKVQVDVRLDEIVLHTLEKEPERRYQHASEIKTDVETVSCKSKTPLVCEDRIPAIPSFSRAATVGACCAPLVIIGIPFMAMVVRGFQGDPNVPGFFELLVTMPFALPGLAAPFATTILGRIAIAHIRQSAGRLSGMGLALFDALVFPLLALNYAIFEVFRLIQTAIPADSPGDGPPGTLLPQGLVTPLMLIICGLLDFFLIRRAWRKANAGLEPVQGQTGQTPHPAAASHAPSSKELHQPDQHAIGIEAAVETVSSKSKTPLACEDRIPDQRRFSRAAIVGACWASLGLLLLPVIAILLIPEFAEKSRNLTPLRIMMMMAVLGVPAVFGTTILGIVSITNIRQSAGRLYGMGLAVFDALLFPLLALDIAISAAYLSIRITIPAGTEGGPSGNLRPSIILLIPIICALDFFIIRWAWRKANAGLEPERKQTDQTNTNSKTNIGKMSLVLAIGGVVAAIGLALVLAIIEWLTDSKFEPPYILCLILFVALEIAALATGIIARRTAKGKAGLTISAILLILTGFSALHWHNMTPSSTTVSGPMTETTSPAVQND